MKPFILACLISLASIPTTLRADTWHDPTFKEMMEESELIGVFRVVEGGAFKARLVPVNVYKGRVSGEIWIGGFSNKYGPIDTLEVGQSYLLFINKAKKQKSRYGSSSNAGDKSIAQASYDASVFVGNQKNGYFVPTPTSGEYRVVDDKVFIDLAEVNNKVQGFLLQDLKRLLEYQFKGKDNRFVEHCKAEARKNLHNSNIFLLTNYLATLVLTAPVAYDELFKEIASDTVWQARFTLAKLLGEVKGVESRDLLVRMLGDSVGVVQGEAIRQLAKNESPSFLGPLLLRQLDSASNLGLYPSLMSSVRNTRESGKIEIIETLADMNYMAAIPHLSSLLNTEDEYVFKRTLNALVKLGSTDFFKQLNERLSDPNLSAPILFDITRIIEKQKLVQCKDGLIAQLTKHNRNENRDKTIALSTLVTLAEQDPTIENLINTDFQNFFTYYDTLQSFHQVAWLEEYIMAGERMKSEILRPLVYRAIYEWNGLNPNVFASNQDFKLKYDKEDSLRREFMRNMEPVGYKLLGVIFFQAETSHDERFIVSVQMPDDSASFARRKKIADAMNLKEENVFLMANEGWCWLDCQYRFEENFSGSPVDKYIKYAEACANETDLRFLKSLAASGRWESKYFDSQLSRAVAKIEIALASRKN